MRLKSRPSKTNANISSGMMSVKDIINSQPNENEMILGDSIISRNQLTLFVGPPDIGKSRLIVQLVADFYTKEENWLQSLEIHQRELKVLFIQTENGLRRVKMDVENQLKRIKNSKKRKSFKRNIMFFIPQKMSDFDMDLRITENMTRLENYVRKFSPDLIIFDPYGDFLAGDNENSAGDHRRTIKQILQIAESGSTDAAVILMHHALPGKGAAQSALGYDATAYVRGSKSVTAIARCQINLAPVSSVLGEGMIIVCAKNNNGQKFKPISVKLDADAMCYKLNSEFDVEQWQRGIRSHGGLHRRNESKVTWELVEKLLTSNGSELKRKLLREAIIKETKLKESAVYKQIKEFLDQGKLIETAKGVLTINTK